MKEITNCLHCGDKLTEYLWCKHCGDQTLLDEYTGEHNPEAYPDDQLDKVNPHVAAVMFLAKNLGIEK